MVTSVSRPLYRRASSDARFACVNYSVVADRVRNRFWRTPKVFKLPGRRRCFPYPRAASLPDEKNAIALAGIVLSCHCGGFCVPDTDQLDRRHGSARTILIRRAHRRRRNRMGWWSTRFNREWCVEAECPNGKSFQCEPRSPIAPLSKSHQRYHGPGEVDRMEGRTCRTDQVQSSSGGTGMVSVGRSARTRSIGSPPLASANPRPD
jgi:hypothetical protein